MSERSDVPTTATSPAQPGVPQSASIAQAMASHLTQPPAASSAAEEDARARIAILEREAKALGNDPAAAVLFHEIGLLWEDPLRNPRNAAVAYQNAYKLAPRFLSNIRAARRLFSDVGNWQMVVQLIDAELAATSEPRPKAGLLFEKAQILEHRLSREEDAATTLKQTLELRPQDLSLLVQLEQAYAEKADHAALVEVYRLLAGSLSDDALKAHYLASAGQLLEDRLNRPDAAASCYREAFGLDRRSPLLLAAMKGVAEREGAVDDLLSALAAEAELLGRDAGPVYLQIAKVYTKLGRAEDALAALLAARRESPQEPLVLSELAQIYESQGRHEELADVLLALVASITDESELAAINLRLAALFEENLKRDQDAIGRYQAILARIPGHSAALAGLGKLYYRSQDWAGLLATYDAELAALTDARQKAARMYKAAEVLEERLGRQEEAIARYNQCLQLQPGYLPAQKALSRLYEKQSRFAELVAMHEQDLLQTADREQIISTLHKMASLYEDRLSDLDRAIECMRRVLELVSDHLPTIRNLSRLFERAGKWKELIEIHETEAALAGDTKQVLSLHHHNAELLEEQLKDRAGAIAAYERLLSLSPSYLPALKALGRLYAQDARWHDLVRMYRAEAEISPSTEQAAALIHKVGELYEQKLGDENEAIASYQEVLTLCPSYFPAVRALARIYRSQGAWESLIEVLRAEAANRTDPVERANALYQSAGIWEDQLGRTDMAAQGCQEVLRLTPGHAAALRALERLATAQNDVKELIAVLDRQTQVGESGAKVTAYLKLSRIYLDRLNEPNRAAQGCEAALAREPSNLGALKTLERIRAGDRARRAELKSRLSEAVGDQKLRAALRLSASADHDATAIATPDAGAHTAQLSELRNAFAADPTDSALAFALERSLRLAHDFLGLVELYERRIAASAEPSEQLELTLRVADLCELKLGDLQRAAAAYQRSLEMDPTLLPALQGARRVCLRLGDYAGSREALETEAKLARDVRTAIDCFVAAGRLSADQLGDPDRAAANFRKALERDPLDPTAGAGLEQILAASGDAADLAALHERKGEAKLAQKDTAAAAAEFYSAARTYLDRLGDRERALLAAERALAAQPTHPEGLELKGDLAIAGGHYAEAAAAFAVRVQQGGEAKRLSAIHLKLGAIYHDQLSDLTRAAAHLQTALSGDPSSAEALERLAAIHTVSRNWTGAADCLKRLLEIESRPEAAARHHLALARIQDEGFGDAAQAAALYRRALELAPGDGAVIDRLAEIYQRTGNLSELVQILEQQAPRAGDAGRAVSLRLRVGELYAKSLDQPQRAVTAYRAALEMDPECVPAHAALADLYMRDAAAAPMAIEEHRALLRLDPTRVESLHALFRLWEGLKHSDKAFCAAGMLHYLKAANEAETAFYSEAKNRIPQDCPNGLTPIDIDNLMHPGARNVLVEIFRAIGDQLTKLHPPQFEALGIDRKADRLKPDHAVHKAVRAVAQVLGVEDFEVYQARRGMVFLETTEPLAVCVGQDVVRKFNAREQKFLIGRAVLGLHHKTAIASKLANRDLIDLLGNSVRIFHPEFALLGQRSDETSKQLRKAYSRKALKALEAPATTAAAAHALDVQGTVEALSLSANRAGLLLCGDVAAGLNMLLRDDPNFSSIRGEGADLAAEALRRRPDVRELFAFGLSDDFFRLRQKVGLAA
ncbi:MAG: tetratricopeptide repeat protein [Myxococcales bacterium]|nr:tetratricopeptide repeat protein [Myxococcales bacterium]